MFSLRPPIAIGLVVLTCLSGPAQTAIASPATTASPASRASSQSTVSSATTSRRTEGSRATGAQSPTTPITLGTYSVPVTGALVVLRPFSAPTNRYAAGHRGVDLLAESDVVQAAGDGVVSFSGTVAGRGVVVISHPDGISTEYEPVAPEVVTRQQVRRGDRIGSVSGTHDGCPSDRCLHWGARRGQNYLDPLRLLAPLARVRLLPWSTDR